MPRVHLKQVATSGATNGQFPKYNSTSGNWEPATSSTTTFPYKAGSVLAASFSGSPKKATITFTTPFADANYAVTLASYTSGNTGFGSVVNSQTASGFVINMNVNNITNLTSVFWIALKNGETT